MSGGRGSLGSPAASRSRKRARPAARKRAPKLPRGGWWGDGPAPWKTSPGVTLELAATWVPECRRWESHGGRYYFDGAAADLACDFFPGFLKHHKGEFAGRPFELLPYQDQLVIRPLFGWKRASDGLRRFRKVFLAVPKGSGKSPLGSGLALFLTFCDNEEGAEVYSAAADREQAAIVFDTAKIMVEGDEELSGRSEVLRRAISVPATHSIFRVLSADVAGKHGPNIHGLIFDEFHAQKTRELFEVLQRGMVKRRQPVLLMITTAGDDDESICYEEWGYARQVQSGTIPDETYLPVIFEAGPKDDWTLEETWRRVNPGYGVTVKADAIASECAAAQAEPRKLNDFLRYHLNRWVNQVTAWIPVDWWDACDARPIDEGALGGLQIFAGLDMAQKHDLTALTLVFREMLAGPAPEVEVVGEDAGGEIVKRTVSLNYRLTLVPFFWIPKDTMRDHIRRDRVPYDQWAAAGLVRATEGNVIDYDQIIADITGEPIFDAKPSSPSIVERFPQLRAARIGYDPAFATDIAMRLRNRGYQTVEILQNYKHLSEPSLIFESMVRGGRVSHGGHPVLRWNLENVAIRRDDAGRIRPVKPKQAGKRIDGIVSAIIGVAVSMLEDVTGGPSIYETPERAGGLLVI